MYAEVFELSNSSAKNVRREKNKRNYCFLIVFDAYIMKKIFTLVLHSSNNFMAVGMKLTTIAGQNYSKAVRIWMRPIENN
jgi:hypothetical protein